MSSELSMVELAHQLGDMASKTCDPDIAARLLQLTSHLLRDATSHQETSGFDLANGLSCAD